VCGRFSITNPRQLALRFGLETPADALPARFNVAPSQPVPVIVTPHRLEEVRWGLIPWWAKDPSIGARLINARAESLETKAAFRDAFRSRRCLVIADGFYEWKKSAKRGGSRPVYIRLKSHEPFAFAGLWDSWRAPDGTHIRSCSIITTEANALIAPIHDRMPAVLRPEHEARWIDDQMQAADLVELLEPYPSHLMEAWPVSREVNSPAHEGPGCIVRIEGEVEGP
jgi:putative SOS response-associated peptidase YedK